ncbi:MAG: hypothetical protein NZ959_07845 [Armatimonadetes bacterium]|nr:hypothetical protein [Armatimonadota bacterium]MDW8121913.1 DUF6785 family protein [Armatimonadota bacterium]
MVKEDLEKGAGEQGLSSYRLIRSLLIGLLLSVPNAYWVMQVEGIWFVGEPTCISFFSNVGFTLVLLSLLNLLWAKVMPSAALQESELVLITVLLSLCSSLAGHDCWQLGIPPLAMVYWYGLQQPALRWKETFLDYVPQWLIVTDMTALRDFFYGHTTFYRWHIISAWLLPIFWWTLFAVALGAVYTCLILLFRKRWVVDERLAYPLIQIPLTLIDRFRLLSLTSSPFFWWGAGIAAFIDILNGLNGLYPIVPKIPVQHADPPLRLERFLTHRPWSAAAPPFFSFPLYPFMIGLGYLMPIDASFSVWFFYLFRKALLVFTDWLGYLGGLGFLTSGPPYLVQQTYGAWLALALQAIWTARSHLKSFLSCPPDRLSPSSEPFNPRFLFALLFLSFSFLVLFTYRGGMRLSVALLYFGVFFLWSLAIAKCRASLGPPAHEMVGLNSAFFIAHTIGMSRLRIQDKVMMPFFWWFNGRGHRTHQMPIILEGFKMAQVCRLDPRCLSWVLIFGMGIGTIFAFWSALHPLYQVGGHGNPLVDHNWGQLNTLRAWIDSPEPVDVVGVLFIFVGIAVTFFLDQMKSYLWWFPFHPAGYALSLTFGVDYFWSCLLIASLIKFLVLRYGGQRAFQRTVPFMMGLVLGEYTVGAFWSALSVALQRPIYDIYIRVVV